MRYVIYPYKMQSGSAKALCSAIKEKGLRSLLVFPDRKYVPKPDDCIINWGSSTVPTWEHSNMINKVVPVKDATCKITSLEMFEEHEVPTLVYTTVPDVAKQWLDEGQCVVARTMLRASSGRGIHMLVPGNEVIQAPLYTKYSKKKREYRLHVLKDKVIDWQQKMTRKEYEGDVDYQIRNHHNGWVYARKAATDPEQYIIDAAVKAVQAIGLDFGAVDIGQNVKKGTCDVYEVNTAPGLFGTTLKAYADAFVGEDNAV